MKRRLMLGLLALLIGSGAAQAHDTVTLHLKWRHAFQFAGIYAALAQGYYRQEGLDVRLVEGGPGIDPVAMAKRPASYAIADTGVLIARAQGAPIRVVACIFQHSPLALLVLRDAGIRSFADLRGKRIMLQPGLNTDLVAALRKAGIGEQDFIRQAISYDLRDLIEGRTDAYAAYLTDQPHQLDKLGIAYRILNPNEYGIDFYGDLLITSDTEIDRHPERVRAMIRATARGWTYALEHPHELVDLILQRYNTQHFDADQLQFEAEMTARMILKDIVPIGLMSPYRWRKIAETYAELGLIPAHFDVMQLLYQPSPDWRDLLRQYRWPLLVGVLTLLLLAAAIQAWLLRRLVRARTRQLRLLSSAVEQSSDMLLIVNPTGRIEYANPSFNRRTGYAPDDVRGKAFAELAHIHAVEPGQSGEIELAHCAHGGWSGRARLCCGNGFEAPVLASVFPVRPDRKGDVHFVAAFHDLSRIETMEAEMAQIQRLEAVGVLAGGIAHNFNNLLAAMLGTVELATYEHRDTTKILRRLHDLESLVHRGADTVAKLLAFARKSEVEIRATALSKVVDEAAELARLGFPESIRLTIHSCNEPLYAMVDAHQLMQVVLNMINNAVDACAQTPDPEIRLALERIVPDAGLRARHASLRGGPLARITVADNGCGMSPATLANIFEPFFTTKEVGKGTGLGLSMAYGIIERFGGFIEVTSTEGEGSTFQIYLPLTACTPPPSHAKVTSAKTQLAMGHGEWILLADDDANVRSMTQSMLERLNYRVVTAVDGAEALTQFEQHRGELALAVLDMVMPRLSGTAAASRMREHETNFPILFITGYDLDASRAQVADWRDTDVLAKPFSIPALARHVATLRRRRS